MKAFDKFSERVSSDNFPSFHCFDRGEDVQGPVLYHSLVSCSLNAFLNKVWLEHSHSHLFVSYICFTTALTGLSNCNRDLLALKLLKFILCSPFIEIFTNLCSTV